MIATMFGSGWTPRAPTSRWGSESGLKPGTKESRGGVLEFLHNEKLDAKNLFDLPY